MYNVRLLFVSVKRAIYMIAGREPGHVLSTAKCKETERELLTKTVEAIYLTIAQLRKFQACSDDVLLLTNDHSFLTVSIAEVYLVS